MAKDAMKKNRDYQKLEHKEVLNFLNTIKTQDHKKVVRTLQQNSAYVKGNDFIGLSAQHWAVMKEDIILTDQFCKLGADVNAKDLLDRTPIYFAVNAQNYNLTRCQLLAKAKPWATDAYNLLDMTKSSDLFSMIKSAKRLHLLLDLAPKSSKQQIWDKQSVRLIQEKREIEEIDKSKIDFDSTDKNESSKRNTTFRYMKKKFTNY